MKSLNHYTDEAISKALADNGAFYAFSNDQYLEQKQPNIIYQRGPNGLIIPKGNADALILAMRSAIDIGITQRLLDYPIDDIISYELANYECYYSGDIDDAVSALAPYNVTYDQVYKVYQNTRETYDTTH